MRCQVAAADDCHVACVDRVTAVERTLKLNSVERRRKERRERTERRRRRRVWEQAVGEVAGES